MYRARSVGLDANPPVASTTPRRAETRRRPVDRDDGAR